MINDLSWLEMFLFQISSIYFENSIQNAYILVYM
jgi:hypothetical protein